MNEYQLVTILSSVVPALVIGVCSVLFMYSGTFIFVVLRNE